jgi:hypothetical protein
VQFKKKFEEIIRHDRKIFDLPAAWTQIPSHTDLSILYIKSWQLRHK